jgi:DNA polymerase-3 subunit beta
MKSTINKEDLLKALTLINGIVEKKSTRPIMSNVLLTAEDGFMTFAGADGEIASQITVPSKVKVRGSTTVNAKMFSEIVRELPEGDVDLSLDEGERLEITAKNSRLKILGVSAQEYPSLPGLVLNPKGKIESAQLLEMIKSTIYAVSSDETRYNLSGVCFESLESDGIKIVRGKKSSSGNSLRLIATDGHRLALVTRPAPSLNFTGRVIAPKKGLQELKKVIESTDEGEISFDITEGFIVVQTKDTKLTMRLVDGEFPDYTRAIPEKEGTKISIASQELAQALRRVSLVVTDKEKSVKFDLSDGMLFISSASAELGEAAESISVDYKGPNISVGFNARYVREIMEVFGENQQVIMELQGDSAPGRFYLENDDSAFGVVMPMRIV